jgi:hypothetical protein
MQTQSTKRISSIHAVLLRSGRAELWRQMTKLGRTAITDNNLRFLVLYLESTNATSD